MDNIKLSEFEDYERRKKNYETYKKAVAPYSNQLYLVRKMMSNNTWCDVTITATGYEQDTHPSGNWFDTTKGKTKCKS